MRGAEVLKRGATEKEAVRLCRPLVVRAIVYVHRLFWYQVTDTLDDALPLAVSEVLAATSTDPDRHAGTLDVLACLLSHGVWPTPKQICMVTSAKGFQRSRKCFLDAICSAVNPLLVGMILSLTLAEAAELGNEGQRQVVARLQKEVEDLVLEVFERLPKTVDGFQAGGIEHTGMDVSWCGCLCCCWCCWCC